MKSFYTLVFLVLCLVCGCVKGSPVGSETLTQEVHKETLTQEVETLTQEVETLTQEVEQQHDTVSLLQQKLDQHVSMNMPVAFTASLTNTIATMGTKQIIVFDNVITNVGRGYNRLNGHFTAPVSGVYAFFVVITNTPGHACSVQLLRNGHFIGHVLAHTNIKQNYLTSTLAVTVSLKKGNQVWVQNEGAYSSVEQMDGGYWSVYSGHLISATY